MNIKSSQNTKLYGLNNYFNDVINLYNLKKMPNKILFSGKKGLGKSTLAYHIINYILSSNEDIKYDLEKCIINKNSKSFNLLKNNIHPNFFLIDLVDEKKTIDILQIREMISYANKSTFNNLPKCILIDNVENLNKNSTNALLKIIEEPNHNIYFILIHNNEKDILKTLKSRCINFNVKLSFNECISIANLILETNILETVNHDLIDFYSTPGDFINLVNFANDKNIDLKKSTLKSLLLLLIDNAYYKKNKSIKDLIINFIELYFLKEYKVNTSKASLLDLYRAFVKKIDETEKFNLDEESLFLEFKSKMLNE